MDALGGVLLSPEAAAGFLAELHEKFCEYPRIIGLLLERVGVAEAFPFKVYGVDLMASQAQIPVIAEWYIRESCPRI
jgi:hypothetical protein